jgi:hypothetical protein
MPRPNASICQQAAKQAGDRADTPKRKAKETWGNTQQTSYAPNAAPISEILARKLHEAAMPCIHRQQENNLGAKEQRPMHSEPRVVFRTT